MTIAKMNTKDTSSVKVNGHNEPDVSPKLVVNKTLS